MATADGAGMPAAIRVSDTVAHTASRGRSYPFGGAKPLRIANRVAPTSPMSANWLMRGRLVQVQEGRVDSTAASALREF